MKCNMDILKHIEGTALFLSQINPDIRESVEQRLLKILESKGIVDVSFRGVEQLNLGELFEVVLEENLKIGERHG